MRNTADLGYLNNVRNAHVCYMKFDFVRILQNVGEIGTKYLTYWYQFFTCCEKLVPILHCVAVQHGCMPCEFRQEDFFMFSPYKAM